MNQSLQNKLITLGLGILLIVIMLVFSYTPSGVSRIKDKVSELELNNHKRQQKIDSSFLVLKQNEFEKKKLRDSIKNLTVDKIQLTKEVLIEKGKYKDISRKYKKLASDSLVVKINNLADSLSQYQLVINRRAGESCLEINDSLQVAKSVIFKQDTLLHTGDKIILAQESFIDKQKLDSLNQANIINEQQGQISNKNEEIHLVKSKNKEDNAKHRKIELGLGVLAVLFLLL